MMRRWSKSSKEKSLATDGVSMATLLSASLHPYKGPCASRGALRFWAACQTYFSAKNKVERMGDSFGINSFTSLHPPVNHCDFMACTFVLRGIFGRASSKSPFFPDESFRENSKCKMDPMTSHLPTLQRKGRLQNTSLLASFFHATCRSTCLVSISFVKRWNKQM